MIPLIEGKQPKQFPTYDIDGTNFFEAHSTFKKAVERARTSRGPSVIVSDVEKKSAGEMAGIKIKDEIYKVDSQIVGSGNEIE